MNESPYGPSPKARAALAAFDEAHRYPPFDAGEVRLALSRYTGKPAEQIICGAGLDDVLNTLMHTIIEPGDEVIISEPTFGVYCGLVSLYGGVIVDRIGSARTLAVALATMAAALAAIALTATFASGLAATVVVLALTVVWGASGWAFYPAQSSRLVEVAPGAAVVVLSLNSSALFFGQAGGAALGAAAQTVLPLTELGLVGAASALLALGVLFWSRRSVPLAAVAPAE